MMRLAAKWLISALAIFIADVMLPGIHVPDIATALWAALALGLLNVFVRPILFLFTIPVTILTFGLFTFFLNGVILYIASIVVSSFAIDSIWWAMLAAFVISFITTVLNRLFLWPAEHA